MHSNSPGIGYLRTQPATGPHLLDASLLWTPGSAVQRVLSNKARWLKQQGWRHSLLAPGVTGPGRIDCGGVPLPGSGGLPMLVDGVRARRLIEQAQPDIVEAADPTTLAWAALRATARLGVPAVAFCHNDLPQHAAQLLGGSEGLATMRGRWAARRARHYLAELYAQFDLVLAPSQTMAERLRACGVPQALVQPLGVDCQTFSPIARDPAWRLRLCERLGLPATTRLLVTSGRFVPGKNLQLLSDAVRLLGPGCALLALGAGPRMPSGRGVFPLPSPGGDAVLARVLASCDAYVHAGDQEAFGSGALEAMACGTPVVVSAAGAAGQLAEANGLATGITVNRRTAQEWAQAISACLLAGNTALRRAALAQAHAHDWPLVLEQLSRRYLGLLGLSAPTAGAVRAGTAAELAAGQAPTSARMRMGQGSSATAQPRLAPRFVGPT